ncbi:MAG: glycosyltransferase family 4 protein [Bacteroidia bacterium]|nr:glycosyltransferase family 4 protein [Bacteroidia bacterium]
MSNASIIAMHPNGNANVRAALSGFVQAGLLKEFHTAIACFDGSLLDKISIGPLSEIKRRHFDSSLKPYTHTHSFNELMRLVSLKAGWKSWYKHEIGRFSVDAVYRSMDKMLANKILSGLNADAVYAYEDGAEFSFMAAKKVGMKSLYDLPIGYWKMARNLLQKEIELRPEWGMTITGFNDSLAKLERKDHELELADEIYVASSFTAHTLSAYPAPLKSIKVVPYGFPTPRKKSNVISDKNIPLKVLYVGGLSQRKGIANLFEAASQLGKSIELTVVGGKGNVDCPALDKALLSCRWMPSLPHHEILNLMNQQDVLVFQSLFEGFGLVITEAMSQGTPVITTDRTAGPDIIQNNHDGWIIEAGSTFALVESLERIIQDRNLLAEVSHNAFNKALSRTWSDYGNDLALEIKNYLHSNQVMV